jgi:hypothetical protein
VAAARRVQLLQVQDRGDTPYAGARAHRGPLPWPWGRGAPGVEISMIRSNIRVNTSTAQAWTSHSLERHGPVSRAVLLWPVPVTASPAMATSAVVALGLGRATVTDVCVHPIIQLQISRRGTYLV